MLSKGFADAGGSHWLPHLMFFVPHDQMTAWGACLEELPIICHEGSEIETTVLLIPVRAWFDGSTAMPAAAPHTHDHR